MSDKKVQLLIRKKLLISFRRYLSLLGDGASIHNFLSMNAWELREYLQRFFEPGMSWDNYKSVWCVDHIVPLMHFNVFDTNEMK